ncbi:MAG: hypothetical protein L0958_06570 [Candidatus Mariimomonas ferrooxydans]
MKDESIDRGRREFFKKAFSSLGVTVREIVKSKADIVPESKHFIRPPGLWAIRNFFLYVPGVTSV